MSAATKSLQPKVELDKTRDALIALGLEHSAEVLGDRLATAVKADLPAHRFLDDLLAAEIAFRDERRVRTSLRLSGLPPGQTLDGFDWSFQPSIDRKRIDTLATCAYVRGHEVVLFQGPPGVGKTHLAVALASPRVLRSRSSTRPRPLPPSVDLEPEPGSHSSRLGNQSQALRAPGIRRLVLTARFARVPAAVDIETLDTMVEEFWTLIGEGASTNLPRLEDIARNITALGQTECARLVEELDEPMVSSTPPAGGR